MRLLLALRRLLVAGLGLGSMAVANTATATWQEQGYAVDSRPGVKQVFVIATGAEAPERTKVTQVALLFPGGPGAIGQVVEGPRSQSADGMSLRGLLAERIGVAVAIGLPTDQMGGLSLEWRESREHEKDVGAAVAILMKHYPAAKLTLVGYSNGARSASFIAAALLKDKQGFGQLAERLRGVVLVSASSEAFRPDWIAAIETLKGHEGLAKGPQKGRVPLLVVHHRRDSCLLYKDIENDAKWFDFISVDDSKLPRASGGARNCGGGSAHQFGAKQEPVYRAVAEWILTGKVSEIE